MKIKAISDSFIMPTKGSDKAGAFDIYMPTAGIATQIPQLHDLGFCAEVPEGYVALLFPRSSTGSKYGLELNNTCGVIDSDYRGSWKASIRTKGVDFFQWQTGERLLQFMLVPVFSPTLELVDELSETDRGTGGFGSSGK